MNIIRVPTIPSSQMTRENGSPKRRSPTQHILMASVQPGQVQAIIAEIMYKEKTNPIKDKYSRESCDTRSIHPLLPIL